MTAVNGGNPDAFQLEEMNVAGMFSGGGIVSELRNSGSGDGLSGFFIGINAPDQLEGDSFVFGNGALDYAAVFGNGAQNCAAVVGNGAVSDTGDGSQPVYVLPINPNNINGPITFESYGAGTATANVTVAYNPGQSGGFIGPIGSVTSLVLTGLADAQAYVLKKNPNFGRPNS